jgi:hypothetical protein
MCSILVECTLLAAFGATVRDETDLERLTSELLRVVDETMQPEFVGLWLKPVDGVKRETQNVIRDDDHLAASRYRDD